jgi:hypothetical protein
MENLSDLLGNPFDPRLAQNPDHDRTSVVTKKPHSDQAQIDRGQTRIGRPVKRSHPAV